MSWSELALAVLLAVAGALVTCGVTLLSVPAGFITGGLLLAGWALFLLLEVDGE